MTNQDRTDIVRLMVTGIVIAEYALRRLQDNTKQDLKMKVKGAINQCLSVQNWFIHHTKSSPQTANLFKKQFNSNEILLLSELLETCFPLDEFGIEEVIKAVRIAMAPVAENSQQAELLEKVE